MTAAARRRSRKTKRLSAMARVLKLTGRPAPQSWRVAKASWRLDFRCRVGRFLARGQVGVSEYPGEGHCAGDRTAIKPKHQGPSKAGTRDRERNRHRSATRDTYQRFVVSQFYAGRIPLGLQKTISLSAAAGTRNRQNTIATASSRSRTEPARLCSACFASHLDDDAQVPYRTVHHTYGLIKPSVLVGEK